MNPSLGDARRPFAAAAALTLFACGGMADPSSDDSADKELIPRDGRPWTGAFAPELDPDKLDRLLDQRAIGGRDMRVIDLPLTPELFERPTVLGFEGTLDELRRLSPKLAFEDLQIAALRLGASDLDDGPIRIQARVLEVAGDILLAEDALCSGAPPARMEVYAERVSIEGAVNLGGRYAIDCPAGPGGSVLVEAETIELMGALLVSGGVCSDAESCAEARGGQVILRGRTEIVLGEHRLIDVRDGDDALRHGRVDIESPSVRQVFPTTGPHLLLPIDQRVEGRSGGDYMGDALARCAAELGLAQGGEAFHVSRMLPAGPVRLLGDRSTRLVAAQGDRCLDVRDVSTELGEEGWIVEVEDAGPLQIGISAPSVLAPFNYTFVVESPTN